MKTAKKRPTPSEKSLANLKPIRSSEEARRYGAIGNEKKKELKENMVLLVVKTLKKLWLILVNGMVTK